MGSGRDKSERNLPNVCVELKIIRNALSQDQNTQQPQVL